MSQKIKIIFHFLFYLLLVSPSFGQTASILPQGYTQYFDANGNPVSAGKVFNYIVGTTTFKNTWQDSGETILNTNPVILDAAGKAKILGQGAYRQIIQASNGNLIWDAVTSSTGAGGSSVSTGDGDLVGTIKPWAGIIAPNQYAFAAGQEVSRTTFSVLMTAITQTINNVVCTSSSPILTGFSDTSSINYGGAVEISCMAPGTVIVSKTASTVTVSNNATISNTLTGVFFPFGNGDGSTTFNLPDLRGRAIAGRDNMNGVVSGRLAIPYFGTNSPDAQGGTGGTQNHLLVAAEVPQHTHVITDTDPGHTHTVTASLQSGTTFSSGGITGAATTPAPITSSNSLTGVTSAASYSITTPTTITITVATPAVVTWTAHGFVAGQQVVFQTTKALPTGITAGTIYFVIAAGLTTNNFEISATLSGSPINTLGSQSGTQNGQALVVNTAFATVQPTMTMNYIIKTTPDANSASATGVTSLGGMTGSIACGSGLTCTGNIISSTGGGSGTPGGSSGNVQFNSSGAFGGSGTLNFISPTLSIGSSGSTGALSLAGTTSGNVTQTVQAIAGTPTITWGTTSGTPVVTGSLPLSINSTTGNMVCTSCALTTGPLSQFASTTSLQLFGILTDPTGTGNVVYSINPTLVTPVIGVATASSINGLTLTPSTGIFTLTNAKTFSVANSLALAGVDSTTITFQGTDTYVGRATTDTLTNKTYDTAGTGNVFKINGTSITAIGGNTAKVGTVAGALTSGHCVSIDANLNFVDAGGACTTGGGGGTVTAGTAGQLAYYATSSTIVSGNANLTISSGAVTLGVPTSVQGSLLLSGATSGTITVVGQAAAGTFNFNLPTTAGSSGGPLLSGGGGASPMTWGTIAGNTSKFATVSGSLTNTNCTTVDANGNLISSTGVACIALASATSGGIPYFSSTSAIASSALLSTNAIVIGGGAGTAPFTANAVTLVGADHSSLNAASTTSSLPQFVIENATADGNSASFLFQKVRSGGGNDTQSGDSILELQAQGFASAGFQPSSRFRCVQAAASSGANIPTKCLIVTSNAAGQVNQTLTFDNGAHVGTTQATAPTAGTCGTSPAITAGSTDFSGQITVGTGSPTSCAVNFATSYTTAPNCIVQSQIQLAAFSWTTSVSAITVTQTGTSSNKITWHCPGL